jgi:hypothetical protein
MTDDAWARRLLGSEVRCLNRTYSTGKGLGWVGGLVTSFCHLVLWSVESVD